LPWAQGKESGRFLKKAAQKLLLNWACGSETRTAKLTKFFATFCSQKVALSFRSSQAKFSEDTQPKIAMM
jgi:hypothetical protein